MTLENDPLAFRFFNEIGIIEQLASSRLERCLPDGLKDSQFRVLNHLVRLGGEWSPVRLANAFQVTKGAMTNTIKRLDKRGLIAVSNDPEDGRGKLVSITDAGIEMRNQCIESIAPLLIELSKEFSPQEFSAVLPVLEKIRKYLDANRL